MQLTIDPKRDTYEQAIPAVRAAYGLNPATLSGSWPDTPVLEPRPGPELLSSEDLWQGWTDRLLFDTVAAVMPRARAVLRRLVEVGGTACYDDIREHVIDDPATPIPRWRHRGSSGASRRAQCRWRPPSLPSHQGRSAPAYTACGNAAMRRRSPAREGNDVDHSWSAVCPPAVGDQRLHGGCVRLSRRRRVGLGLGGRSAQAVRKVLAKPYHHADLLRDHGRPPAGGSVAHRGELTAA
ncbi:hypothetical protein [Streptomyces sp. NPDC048419]|uniref:hypothetical protein n=1 Tax=Streptomyces sp. NPDC048419 TaxID=3365547 RepID=UPI0037143B16